MFDIVGKHNQARVFTDYVEETAMAQILELCNQEFTKGSQIRIMPDTHAGAGCTIGTTMTIKDKVVPNLVGVDIGCGMGVTKLKLSPDEINFDQLDEVIKKYVPSGFSIRGKAHYHTNLIAFHSIIAPINRDRAEKSVGTLGGGNHFIELNASESGDVYLVIHSGSRNLGKQVAEHYQDLAYTALMDIQVKKGEVIAELTAQGRQSEIQSALQAIKRPKITKELAYLEGDNMQAYLNDMRIAQGYALWNRNTMAREIIMNMGWANNILDGFDTIHNYIDLDNMILRKGAISAQKDERVIVPINMRDGSLIAVGKGNPDWNYSGPHGAGRVLSRSKAKQNIALEDFQESMSGIWTSSVSVATLDESPFAYKSIEAITDHIGEALEVTEIIKPLYNFKAH